MRFSFSDSEESRASWAVDVDGPAEVDAPAGSCSAVSLGAMTLLMVPYWAGSLPLSDGLAFGFLPLLSLASPLGRPPALLLLPA